jgi:two-component system NtrC family sensor kinase
MFAGKLKIYVAINVAFVLLLGMILIHIVTLHSDRKVLVRSEIAKCDMFISFIQDLFKYQDNIKKEDFDTNFKYMFSQKMGIAGFSDALILDKDHDITYIFGSKKTLHNMLERNTRKAIDSKIRSTVFHETTWGVFKPEKKYLIFSSPLFANDKIIAGISISLNLERLYSEQRSSLKIIIIYILLNILILTFLAVYFLSKVTFKPLQKLLHRAEAFKEHEGAFFLHGNENNEFGKLSAALNRMLKRISEDKDQLNQAVQFLEKANSDLTKAQKGLVQAEKLSSVGRLSAGIAHEIGNPISIIMGYFELLKQKDITDIARQDYLTRAEKEINRINIIIKQLLHFSRPSKQVHDMIFVQRIIDDIVGMVRVQPLTSDMNIELFLNAKDDRVIADSDQLYQVFMNLIINAADAIRSSGNSADGRLTIQSETVDNPDSTMMKFDVWFKVMFIDNGSGIAQDCINKIFDPFYTTKEPGQGTGLGLSVCFTIIESFGGKIEAYSKEGCGTTMTIYLPLFKDGTCDE